jgi:hypothetical protein
MDDADIGCTMRVILAEVEMARKLLTRQSELPEIDLSRTDQVLQTARDYLQGVVTLAEYERIGTDLLRYIHDYTHTVPFATTRPGKAFVDYQSACGNLPGIETSGESPYFICHTLVEFTALWTGCSEAVARRDQLDHLTVALYPRLLDRLADIGYRSRISLLAC